MPIAWNREAIRKFLADRFSEDDSDDLTIFRYKGSLLNYEIYVEPRREVVAIGANDGEPFGSDSIVEVCVACDLVRLVSDGYNPAQEALEFRYGSPRDPESLRLMLLKRPDGDLKIWPAYPMPKGHPIDGQYM